MKIKEIVNIVKGIGFEFDKITHTKSDVINRYNYHINNNFTEYYSFLSYKSKLEFPDMFSIYEISKGRKKRIIASESLPQINKCLEKLFKSEIETFNRDNSIKEILNN